MFGKRHTREKPHIGKSAHQLLIFFLGGGGLSSKKKIIIKKLKKGKGSVIKRCWKTELKTRADMKVKQNIDKIKCIRRGKKEGIMIGPKRAEQRG